MNLEIMYKNCTKCKGKKTFMCDEYENSEYYNFCVRCGYSKKNMDGEKAEVYKCQGTLRYAFKEGKEGFQIGPLAVKDVVPFTEWVEQNKEGLEYAHITYAYEVEINSFNETKWIFQNLLNQKQSEYEVTKDYLAGADIKKDPAKIKKKKRKKI